jgi:DNA polymerase III epsilon subunit-like protein
MGSIDTRISRIETLLRLEHELGRINSLENLADSQRHRKSIHEIWQAIQADLAPISQAVKDLPALPEIKAIRWAQSVLAHRDLRFLELDTTGLEQQDEIIRFVLMDSDERIIEDFFIKTERPCSAEASQANGITSEMLAAGIDVAEAWERMQAALVGNYVISYSQKWDIEQLDKMAAHHDFDPITVIGEDLQRRCTQYYNGEYYLNLFKLAERLGYVMPESPAQNAIHRATAQVRILKAMASAVTDVRPPRKASAVVSTAASTDDGGLGDLDDHPF